MIENVLIEKGIDYELLPRKLGHDVSKLWHETFLANVRQQTGKYVSGAYKWEAYWCDLEPSISGARALTVYLNSTVEACYVMNEKGDAVYKCAACNWPDFSEYSDDIYVFPVSMEWSMVFTHENTCHFAVANGH